jgi:hypothetical protein
LRVAVRYRAVWLLPCFSVVCIVGPTLLSFILLVIVFIGCFTNAPFQRFALPLYGYCSLMSVGVYFGNIYVNEPYIVRVVLANPTRDGVVIPLIMQAAVNGLVAVSWLLYAEAERDTKAAERVSGSHAAKLLSVKNALREDSDAIFAAIRKEWENLNTDGISREAAHRIMQRELGSVVDEYEFALVWGLLSENTDPNASFDGGLRSPTNGRRHALPDDGEEMNGLQVGLLSATPTIDGGVAPLSPRTNGHANGLGNGHSLSDSSLHDKMTQSGFTLMRATIALHLEQNKSGFHVFRLFIKHLMFANTRALTYIGMFLVGTAQSQLDALHLALLFFFVGFAASDRLARAGWVVFMVYCMGLTAFLFFLTAIQGEAFDTLFGQIPESTRSVAGIVELPSRGLLLAYFALIFVAALERATFLHRVPTIRQFLTSREVDAFLSVPLTRKLRGFSALGALLVVLGFRLVFERHTLFMLGYVIFFIISCYMFTFMTNYVNGLRALWSVGLVYGGICLLALAVYQFREVHRSIEAEMEYSNNTEKCPGMCPADIGLLRPSDGEPLTWLLLPSFLTVSLIAVLCMLLNTFFQDIAMPTNPRDFDFVSDILREFLVFVLFVLVKVKEFLIDQMYAVVWLSLFVGASIEVDFFSAAYVVFFMLDLRGRVPLFYSTVHLLVVYVCRFVFVDEHVSESNRELMNYFGLLHDQGHSFSVMVIGPVVVFVTSLFYLNTSGTGFKPGQRRKTVIQPRDETSRATFVEVSSVFVELSPVDPAARRDSLFGELLASIYRAPRALSYEALLLVHMIGSAVSVRRGSGFVHVVLVSIVAQLRRRHVTTNNVVVKLLLGCDMLLLAVSYLLIVNLPPQWLNGPDPFVPAEQMSEWGRYCGFAAPTADPLMFFLAAVVMRFIDAGQEAEGHQVAEAESQTGYATMFDLLSAKEKELTECYEGKRTVIEDILPPTDALEPPNIIERATIRIMCWTMPPAIFTFFYGAGNISFVNTVLCLGGMLMMAHRTKILWNTTTMWPKWEMFCNGFQYLVAICNIPPVANEVLNSSRFTDPFGLVDSDGVLSLSALRIVLLWSVYLQRRAFDSFFFIRILKELHEEQLYRIRRNHELRKYLSDVEAKELAAADLRATIRLRKLEEIRAARRGELLDEHLRAPLLDSNTAVAMAMPASPGVLNPDEEVGETVNDGLTVDERAVAKQEALEADEWVAIAAGGAMETAVRPKEDETLTAETVDKPPLSQRLKGAVDALLISATAVLAMHSRVTKEELMELPSVARRFIAAAQSFVSLHTAEICFLAFAINFTASGSMFDGVLTVSALVYAHLVNPWPRRTYWSFCLVYSTVGIVIKSTVALVHAQQPFDENARRLVTLTLFPLQNGSETGTIFFDLIGDFINFGLVLFHLQVCANTGAYAEKDDDTGSLLEGIRTTIGCGVDLYTICFVYEMTCIVIGVSFYYSLVGLHEGSFLDSVQSNLLPGPLVLAMLGSIVLMTIDRALYITASVRVKFVFHVLLVLGFHVCYVMWMEMSQTNRPAGVAYFVIKQMYFVTSAYQIRHGYPLFRRHDPFKGNPGMPWSVIYTVYRSIPFVWELRVLLDWTFTKTTLKFPYWVKLEDVQNWTYMRQVDEASLREPGTPIPVVLKVFQGGVLYVALVFLLFFPLLMYSTFNPALVSNYMTNVDMTASFGTLSTWYEAGLLRVEPVNPMFMQFLRKLRPDVALAAEGSGKTIQLVTMPQCSAQSWDTSPSALAALTAAFNDTYYNKSHIDVNLKMVFTRRYFTQNSQRDEAIQVTVPVPYDDAHGLEQFTSADRDHADVTVDRFYMPFVLNKPDSVTLFQSQKEHLRTSCELNFTLAYDPVLKTNLRYTCLICSALFFGGNYPNPEYPSYNCVMNNVGCEQFTNGSRRPPITSNPAFVVISDMVPNDSGFLPNIGIIALYTTFILAIGQVLRGALAGTANMTHLQDMQDPHRVDDLVESVLLCQASGRASDLELEGLLYYELIDLLRSSEALLTVTGARAEIYRHKLKTV